MDSIGRDVENSEMDATAGVPPTETPSSEVPMEATVQDAEEMTGSEDAQTEWEDAAPPSTTDVATLPKDVSDSSTNDDDRLMAALAWLSMAILQLPVISIVLLLADGNRSRHFQRYHAINSIAFWIAAVIYETLAAVAFTILVTVSLGCLAVCLWVLFLLPHLVAIYYAFLAYGGKEINIPVISDLVRSQKWI